MIKYRGVDVQDGVLLTGYYQVVENNKDGRLMHCIATPFVEPEEVHPESLAIADTNIKDQNGNVIFASFQYEVGKMSKGGDIVEWNGERNINLHCHFYNGAFYLDHFSQINEEYRIIKVIGNAYLNRDLLHEN